MHGGVEDEGELEDVYGAPGSVGRPDDGPLSCGGGGRPKAPVGGDGGGGGGLVGYEEVGVLLPRLPSLLTKSVLLPSGTVIDL